MHNEYASGPDHYALRAKREGYPARSVYKLEELNEKFHILRHGDRVLDIGAAPGSWSMYALRATSGFVAAIDLNPLALPNSSKNLTLLQGDLFDPTVAERIAGYAPFDVVLSDAAPNTTGNRTVDASRSFEIGNRVIALAGEFLRTGGKLVMKVFQGGDERVLMEQMRARFASFKAFKPKASRSVSFEVYYIGMDKIDADGKSAPEAGDRVRR